MKGYQTKVYVVQAADTAGVLGKVLAVKLNHSAAHAIAKKNAPARVHFVIADKSDTLNVDHSADQRQRN